MYLATTIFSEIFLVYNFFLKFVLKNACYRKWKILSIIQIERYGSFFQPQVSTSEEKLFNWCFFSSIHRSLLQRNIYKNWWVFVNQTSILHRNIYKWIVFVCVRSSKNIIQLLAFNCIFSSPKPDTSRYGTGTVQSGTRYQYDTGTAQPGTRYQYGTGTAQSGTSFNAALNQNNRLYQPVLWIRIWIGSVVSNFVDANPYSEYGSGSA